MIDYYSILQLAETASTEEIKKAYKRLSLIHHPDKPGGNQDRFVVIVKAYETLADDEKRRKYNILRSLFLMDNLPTTPPAGYLKGRTPLMSAAFKHRYASFLTAFRKTKPTPDATLRDCFDNTLGLSFEDFLKSLDTNSAPTHSLNQFKQQLLTPDLALNCLKEFLQGQKSLIEIRELLPEFLNKINALKPGYLVAQRSLYEGVYQTLTCCLSKEPINESLLLALQKISDFATGLDHDADAGIKLLMGQFSVLFASKRFRELYAYALHQYWLSSCTSLDDLKTDMFNDCQAADELFEQLKEQYTLEEDLKLLDRIRPVNLIRKLEKHAIRTPDNQQENKSQFYRDKGYLFLDWIPAIGRLVSPLIVINIFIQAGLCFQQAAREEQQPARQAADEKLAFVIYMHAVSHAQHTTPDLELYANTHLLKLFSNFKYPVDDSIQGIIKILQQRTYKVADVFPFYKTCRPNILMLKEEGHSLILIRNYLHSLMNSYQLAEDKTLVCDHQYLTILYQVYEACLQNWYEINLDPTLEASYRYQLMEELLKVNRWNVADINRLLTPKAVSLYRDPQSWIAPTRTLSFAYQKDTQYFSTINGLEMNFDTGQITLNFKPWEKTDTSYSKLFTYSDIQELFRNKTTIAEFSLDQADPDKAYHPFNKVRFAPSNLYQSELMHTMFLADYLLKFLTVGCEVQAQAPYAMRGIDELIRPLPAHLQRIIYDFRHATTTGATNRFWIEAEELPLAQDTRSAGNSVKLAFNDLNMVVKKHAMTRDAAGNLVDTDHENEGWDHYVLKHNNNRTIKKQVLELGRPAMVWDQTASKVCFFEEGQWTEFYTIKISTHLHTRFLQLKRDAAGMVTPESSREKYLVYSFTKKVAAYSKQAHHFSAEYCFAQEFTHYYNEFATYFPELGRLRELAKAVMITRILASYRQGNLDKIQEHRELLANSKHWEEFKIEVTSTCYEEANSEFTRLRKSHYAKIQNNVNQRLASIAQRIGNLQITADSQEMQDSAKELYLTNYNRISSQYGNNAWNQVSSEIWEQIQSNMTKAASELSQAKYNNSFSQLLKLFENELATYDHYDKNQLVKQFLNGDPQTLEAALVSYEKNKLVHQIQEKVFTHAYQADIRSALEGSQAAVNKIAEGSVSKVMQHAKEKLTKAMNQLERMEKAFDAMGLARSTAKMDLEKVCLWVPASINHQLDSHNRLVFGGVSIAGSVNQLCQSNAGLNNATLNQADKGTPIYRVWGGAAGPNGQCWTRVNPNTVQGSYRNFAGLPDSNTGRFVSEAILKSSQPVGKAVPLHGNQGGICEIRITNPKEQIILTRVSGVNPPF